jgi:hypothetical protein
MVDRIRWSLRDAPATFRVAFSVERIDDWINLAEHHRFSRRSTLPGSAAVIRPSASTADPLTMTQRIPSEK